MDDRLITLTLDPRAVSTLGVLTALANDCPLHDVTTEQLDAMAVDIWKIGLRSAQAEMAGAARRIAGRRHTLVVSDPTGEIREAASVCT